MEEPDLSRYVDAASGADAVAFDVFDTLVVRPFVEPTDLFLFMEKVYGAEGFASARVSAEREARKRIRQEVDLDEIYTLLPEGYQSLKDKEMDLEISLSFPDPSAKRLFDSVRDSGKRIALVSDMYLPSEVIEQILTRNGYSGFEKLYLSNVYDENKASGGLYSII